MFRKSWVIGGLLIATALASGCGLRNRPLFDRNRARGSMPDQCPNNYPYYGGFEGQPMGIPCATPAAPCPCGPIPGGVVPGAMMPGDMELLPGTGLPPLQMQPPIAPAQPGNATPMPAGPSDGSTTGIRKAPGTAKPKVEK